MKKEYDLIIIGMGPSSIFCALQLIKNGYDKKILIVEKGHRIEDRVCPIKKAGKCLKCKPVCSILGGFSGAGAFSDGKLLSYHLSSFNKNNDDIYIGGKSNSYIKDYYSKDEIIDYIKYVDQMYLDYGADSKIEGLDHLDEISKYQQKAVKENLNLIDVPIRHLGTEKSHDIFKKIEHELDNKVSLLFDTEVEDLLIEDNKIKGIKTKDDIFYSEQVVLAVGVNGSFWLEKLCKKYNINSRNGFIDIGIRYELSDKTMEKINKLLYEGKFIGYLPPYNDKVRTYCQNPSGFVTPETYDNGCSLVNGHSYKNKKSNNTNLAILVSYKFDKPFNSTNEYGFNLASKANLLSGGSAIMQRYGDFINGKITSPDDIKKNSVQPTYKEAYPFDLSYVLDYRTMVNLKNYISALGKIIDGFDNEDNILYGPEIKFYGNEIELDKNFMTSVEGLYSIGTGGGLTIGLMMASVSGVMFADKLIEMENRK